MNFKRAKEIFTSTKGVIDVDYNGKSVWLTDVDEDNNTIAIEGIDGNMGKKIVSPDDLSEEHHMK